MDFSLKIKYICIILLLSKRPVYIEHDLVYDNNKIIKHPWGKYILQALYILERQQDPKFNLVVPHDSSVVSDMTQFV